MITSVSSLCILDKSGGAWKPRAFIQMPKGALAVVQYVIELW